MLRYPSLRAPLDILFLVCCIAADRRRPRPGDLGPRQDQGLSALVLGRAAGAAGQGSLSQRSRRLFRVHLSAAAGGAAGDTQLFRQDPALSLPVVAQCRGVVDDGAILQRDDGLGARRPARGCLRCRASLTVSFVFDMFDLGQPNLVLLAMMLYGFWLLQHERPWMAGSMFALATAIKVFPVAVFPYLLWRRQWAAAASMVVFLGIFLFVVPAPVRGFQHNVSELKTWYQGMVGSSSEKGFGQRDEQNWSWVNQSIIAVTHRLTRPVNYNQDDPAKPPRYMNLLDLDFKTANWIVVAISLADRAWLHRGDAAPRAANAALGCRRARDPVLPDDGGLAAGPAILLSCGCSFPITILIHRAAFDPRPAVRRGTWAVLAVAGVLLCLSLPIFPNELQAWGTISPPPPSIAGGLAWHLLHPLPEAVAGDAAAAACLRHQARYNLISKTNPRPRKGTSGKEKTECPSTAQLQPVLDRIDADFDNSLERLFALLRIKSISADPAFAGDCKAAADHLARDIATLGFATEVRPTAGHPAIVAKTSKPMAARPRKRTAACAVLRSLRCAAGRSAQSLAPSAVRARRHRSCRRPQDHRRARRRGRQGPVDDLRRGLPGLEIGDGFAAGRRHHRDRGRGGSRLEEFRAVPRSRTRRTSRPTSRWCATPACGIRTRRRSPPRCAAWSTKKCGSRPPTATCIPASSAAARKTRSGC